MIANNYKVTAKGLSMKKLFLLSITILLSGCAGFATQSVTDIGYKHYSTKNISISYDVNVIRRLNYDAANIQVKDAEKYFSEIISNNLAHPRFFISITDDNPKATYLLEINISNEGSYNKNLNLASYLTLGIIPSVSDDIFYYEVRLINTKTKKVKEFHFKENYRQITHITMLLFMPFKTNEIDLMHKRVMNRISYEVIEHINSGK